jgi:hypothetical protein
MSEDTAALDAPADVQIDFYGAHARAFQDTSLELDVEGAVRSGKTWLCLTKVIASCQKYPGIRWMISRWSDGDTDSQLKPNFCQLCSFAGIDIQWNADEHYYAMPNGSWVYVSGLFSQDQARRYSKMRGKTLAGGYIDQTEEVPDSDIYDEFVLRLSQPGYPRQMIISPQTVRTDKWIAKYFPHDAPLRPNTAYYPLATRDNAHNLEPGWIEDQEIRHPPGTPQHTTLLLGKRGAVVVGEPVYGSSKNGPGAFIRQRHEVLCEYDPKLALEIGLDFGRHHPCAVFRQVSVTGQTRYLGGILGMDLHLDPFLTQVSRYQAIWFPNPIEVRWCGDPAALSNPVGVDMPQILRAHGIHARFSESSNSPMVRIAIIERIAGQLRARDLVGAEAVLVALDDRWIQLSQHGLSRLRFLADAFEFGYVWDKHDVSVSNKPVRRPMKDGWYDHGMNCAEYLEANFGYQPAKPKPASKPLTLPRASYGSTGWLG